MSLLFEKGGCVAGASVGSRLHRIGIVAFIAPGVRLVVIAVGVAAAVLFFPGSHDCSDAARGPAPGGNHPGGDRGEPYGQPAPAGADERVHLWDTTTGVRSATITGHGSSVLAVAFDQEGHGLSTVGEDRTLRRWSLNEDHVRTRLCEVIGKSVRSRRELELLAGAVLRRTCR